MRYYNMDMDKDTIKEIVPEDVRYELDNQKALCYVGEEENKIVCYAVFSQIGQLNAVQLLAFYVDEEYRRNYVGSALMEYCVDDLKKRNANLVYTSYTLDRREAAQWNAFLRYVEFEPVTEIKEILNYDDSIYQNKFMDTYMSNQNAFPKLGQFQKDFDSRLANLLHDNAEQIEMFVNQSAIWIDGSCFIGTKNDITAWEISTKNGQEAAVLSVDFTDSFSGDLRIAGIGMLGHFLDVCKKDGIRFISFYCRTSFEKEMFQSVFGKALYENVMEELILDLREDEG